MGKTTVELVKDLEVEIKKVREGSPRFWVLRAVQEAARTGKYHDFLTQIGAPKVTLYHLMSDLDLKEIAEKVEKGSYDDEKPSDTIIEN